MTDAQIREIVVGETGGNSGIYMEAEDIERLIRTVIAEARVMQMDKRLAGQEEKKEIERLQQELQGWESDNVRICMERAEKAEANLYRQNEIKTDLAQARERIERCRDYAMRIEENEITAADILEVLGYSRDGMTDLEAGE